MRTFSTRMPVAKLLLGGLCLLTLVASCTTTSHSTPTPSTIRAGPAIPDRDIVFMIDENQLGFINDDGSAYTTYIVDMSKWLPNNTRFARTLADWIAWSPDGQFLVSRYTGSHRSAGWPILLSSTGELVGCPEEPSPYGPDRVWVIADTTVLSVDVRDEIGRIVAFDISTCTVTTTFYTAGSLLDESLKEAAVSTQGWLAISRCVRNKDVCSDNILLLSSDGKFNITIPNASYPAWSKEGDWVAFYIYRDGLYVARKDGSDMRKIVSDLDLYTAPSWSPDGQWIIYHRNVDTGDGTRKKTPTIFKVNVATGQEYELFRGGYHPNWR